MHVREVGVGKDDVSFKFWNITDQLCIWLASSPGLNCRLQEIIKGYLYSPLSLPLALNPRAPVDVRQEKLHRPLVGWGDAHMHSSSCEKVIDVKVVNSHLTD